MFRHVSFDYLARISSKDVVRGILKLNFEKDHLCDACQHGKQTKSSFKSSKDVMTTRPLEVIHTNLFGPTQVKSLSKNRYVFVLVDDFPRFTWVFFLGHKNETFLFFNVFCKRVEKEKDFSIVHIHSDRGGEFIN